MNRHHAIADRILHKAGQPEITPDERAALVAEAAARASLAVAQETHLANLIRLLEFADDDADGALEHPLARTIIRRRIRAQLGLAPLSADGQIRNGGNGNGN